jgi:hypothetical protein
MVPAGKRLIHLGSYRVLFTIKSLHLLVKRQALNHRVPGSSPGAPTKLFKDMAGLIGSALGAAVLSTRSEFEESCCPQRGIPHQKSTKETSLPLARLAWK